MSHSDPLVCLMGMTTTVMVVGGGYAGVMAANRAAARGHGVTLVSDRDVLVDRIRLHQVVAGVRRPEAATRDLAASLRGPRLAAGRVGKVAEGTALLDDGRVLSADHVVLATGSSAGRGSLEWALRNREAVAALPAGGRVSVLGAGLTGMETATEIAAARTDLTVCLVDPVPAGTTMSEGARAHLAAVFEKLGVLVSETPVDADLTIECTGFTLDRLALDSGLPTSADGGVEVDQNLRVPGHQRLWACGDAARVEGQPHLRMACASAEPMAAHVADQLGRADRGQPLRPVSIGFLGQCVSLGRDDALVQYVRRDDTPTPRIQTGRIAALGKEVVCRFAVVAPIRMSRWYREVAGPSA